MKSFFLTITFVLLASVARGQAATVIFDYNTTVPTATVQGWTATFYVNNIPFVLTDVCVLVTTVTPNVNRCTATLPDITTALTPTGIQNFTVSLKDSILEGPVSTPPLALQRPSAITNLRIQ